MKMTCYFDIYGAFNMYLQLQISKYLTLKVTIKSVTLCKKTSVHTFTFITFKFFTPVIQLTN